MNRSHAASEIRPRSRDRLLVVFLGSMLVVVTGLGGVRSLRQQRWGLMVLQRRIDTAAAPGEAVVVDDRRIAFEIRHGAPAALRVPMVLLPKPEDALRGQDEVVLVTAESDPALARLRAEGYGVLPDAMAVPSDLYASRRVMVYFVTRQATGASNGTGEQP